MEIDHHLRTQDLIKIGQRLRILEQIENYRHLHILELIEIFIFSHIKCVGHIQNFIIFDIKFKSFLYSKIWYIFRKALN